MKKLYLLFLVTLFFSEMSLQAQSSIGIYFNGLIPDKELCDSGYRHGCGLSAEFLTGSLVKVPHNWFELKLGFGVEYFFCGSATVNDLIFDTPNDDRGYVKMRNRMTGLLMSSKFIFNIGRISPYFDIFSAGRIFTSSQVNTFNVPVKDYETITTNKLLQTGLLHYGYSGGLLYRLNKNTYFDLRVSYSKGGGIDFVKLASVQKDPDYLSNLKYQNVHTTVSDLFTFRVGFVFKLNFCPSCTYDRSTRTFTSLPDYKPKHKQSSGSSSHTYTAGSASGGHYSSSQGHPATVKAVHSSSRK